MKVSTILTRRRFSVWWEYARQWMFRTLVTKKDLKDEIGEVAKEISVQNVHKVVANKREFVPSAEIKDGAIIFRFLTFKQMEKIRILGEDVYITFRLAYDNDEEEITLLTTSDSTLPNEWIDAVGFAYENNVKDSISVEVGTDIASKIDTIEIDGLFGNLLTADATWRLAEIGNKLDNIKLPEIDTTELAKQGDNQEATNSKILEEVQNKLTPLEAVLTELSNGKQEMVDALATKNVQSSTDKTLSQIAGDIEQITQQPISIDGGEMYAEQLFGGVGDNARLHNLYEVLVDIKNNAAYQKYTGFVLCEYLKTSNTINLQGADAYMTSDGKAYMSSAIHTWEDKDNKVNRWVAYFLGEDESIGSFSIANTDMLPTSIHIGGNVGSITIAIDSNIREVVVTEGNYLNDISFANNKGWGSYVILRGTKEHNGEANVKDNANVVFYLDDTKTINGLLISGTCANLKEIIINANLITKKMLAGTYASVENLTINAAKIDTGKADSVLTNNGFLCTGARMAALKQIDCPNLIYVNGDNGASGAYSNYPILEVFNAPNWEEYKMDVSYQIFSQSSLKRITTNLNSVYQFNNYPFVNGCSNLIDFEIGALNSSDNKLFGKWNPTNAMKEDITSLLSQEDIIEGFTSNRQKLLYNIREHIAKKITDRNGLDPLTMTFNQELRNIFDEETELAFSSKNWNISPAKSV